MSMTDDQKGLEHASGVARHLYTKLRHGIGMMISTTMLCGASLMVKVESCGLMPFLLWLQLYLEDEMMGSVLYLSSPKNVWLSDMLLILPTKHPLTDDFS